MDRELKVGIVGSVIGGLALLFIQPILNFLWRLILAVGGTLHQGYVDRIYRNAARASGAGGNPYSEATFLALGVFLGFVGVVWLLDRLRPGALRALMNLTVLFLFIVSLLAMLSRAAISMGTAAIAESFTQRLTVLAPAIRDSEYKILKARWANMRGKADYDALVGAMDKRATELGVNLPPVR